MTGRARGAYSHLDTAPPATAREFLQPAW